MTRRQFFATLAAMFSVPRLLRKLRAPEPTGISIRFMRNANGVSRIDVLYGMSCTPDYVVRIQG